MHLLVVGGNGFLGSAVCKSALARGWQVSSISRSGRPYRSAKGHSPAWVSKVQWHAADVQNPASFSARLPPVTAVVHTVGALFPDDKYKHAIRNNDIPAILSSVIGCASLRNPLQSSSDVYETINRDSG
jgi:uncharacterized protein YbjT (DUF2867 family)